ncbi:MAG: hypothetical protein KAY24_04045, partial [Candidatus Eisenbacteria sp.]|nr:hypothetical protein [Candidatus Eisenbacteria bacterium]
MSFYTLVVNPAGRVAETADPAVRIPATAAGDIGDPATAAAGVDPMVRVSAKAAAATTNPATVAAATDAPATVAAVTADPPDTVVPVSTKLFGFQGRLTAEEVHARLRRSLADMHKAERSVFLWFSEIQERRLYRQLGYSSIQAYGYEELDFTANRVNRYLHLMNDLERLPLISEALHSGNLGWTKARAIVRVSSSANEEHWLKAAMRLSRRDLESKVTRARMQAAARRRGNPEQPDLAPRGGQASEKVLSEKEPSEKAGSGGLGAQVPDYAALQSADSTEAQAKGTHQPQGQDAGELQSQGTGTPQSQATGGDEAPVFRPPAGSPNEALIDDGPVSVVFRFMALDLARY